MKTQKRLNRSRLVGLGIAGLLLALLVGDGSGIAAAARGIDPLDVLDLQVKPNVILVLDSSGSMRETLPLNGPSYNADWRLTKMGSAKKVLREVVAEQTPSVNFLFGIYKAIGGTASTIDNTELDNGNGHFQYMTYVDWDDADNDEILDAPAEDPDDWAIGEPDFREENLDGTKWIRACVAPYTTECELTLPGRGFQAWQYITAGWNHIYYLENGTTCNVTVPIPPNGFYATQAALATAMQTAMNGCSRTGTVNVYTVTAAANGAFTFGVSTFSRNYSLLWANGPNNIAGAIAAYSGVTAGDPQQPTFATVARTSTATYTTNNSIRLLWRDATGFDDEENDFAQGTIANRDRSTFLFRANMFFNGELFYVKGDGSLCNINFNAPVKTDPPTIRFQQLSDCANLTSVVGPVVKVEFAGAALDVNRAERCGGFQPLQALVPCNQAPGPVSSVILSALRPEVPFDQVTTSATFGQLLGYSERTDGTHQMVTHPSAGGLLSESNTPIAHSLIDIKALFTTLWNTGQADIAATTTVNESRAPIRDQNAPREKTIVLFVTDGDDTCSTRTGGASGPTDDQAKRAAHKAEQLYAEVLAGDPDSSVTTYVIGFGSGAQPTRLNWIAWGGSGLGQGTGALNVATTGAGEAERWNETTAQLAAKRTVCSTCQEAFIAPDAATLAAQIRLILSQGASSGEFTAQQALFIPVFELVKEVSFITAANLPLSDPDSPFFRYSASVPNLFRSTFTLPGFKGQLRAFQQSGGVVSLKWSAGQELFDRVTNAMASCNETGGTGILGECLFTSLQTRIDRRIYTTSGNGVFPADLDDLTNDAWLSGTAPGDGNRMPLWPTPSVIAPTNDTTPGLFDIAMGLIPVNDDAIFADLQTTFGACRGSNLSPNCSAAQPLKTQRARREAREIILAHMAGATPALDGNNLPKHVTGSSLGQILYVRRSWMLADSTLATPAAVGPPSENGPDNTGYEDEYILMRDGFRDADDLVVDASGASTRIGFGLKNPDRDAVHNSETQGQPASDLPNLKPSMTVVYSGANDMLHAYRAGPNCNDPGSTTAPFLYTACGEQGGEELWGFVPYDQLAKLPRLVAPQTRANHVYMIASAMRFGDVFVPNPGTASNRNGADFSITIGGQTEALQGLWRRILIFGRGFGGKSYTALDITTAGTYKTLSTNTVPPVVLWNRGNPDTHDGATGGTLNNTAGDNTAYSRMGETWSVPTLAFVDFQAPATAGLANATTRKGSGIDYVLYTGSGFGDRSGCSSSGPCEGTTIFALDALTGDVIAAPDVGQGSTLPAGGYDNAIVANVTAYNPLEFDPLNPSHPARVEPPSRRAVTKVYVGDLHGRLWKIDTNTPGTPILLSDFGIEQPIAAPVAVLGLNEAGVTTAIDRVAHVYVTTGWDNRQDPQISGAFLIAGLKDDVASPPPDNCVGTTIQPPCLFVREMTQDFNGETGFFRGTLQPSTFIARENPTDPPIGRVLFGGTRFNDPSSPFAPVPCTTQTGCNPVIPCRSSFDSVIFALGARTGSAAFDLNDGTGDDSFVVFDNSKIVGITILGAPNTAGNPISQIFVDEGLNRGGSTTPPSGSLPESGRAQTTSATAGGVATTATTMGSVVCQ